MNKAIPITILAWALTILSGCGSNDRPELTKKDILEAMTELTLTGMEVVEVSYQGEPEYKAADKGDGHYYTLRNVHYTVEVTENAPTGLQLAERNEITLRARQRVDVPGSYDLDNWPKKGTRIKGNVPFIILSYTSMPHTKQRFQRSGKWFHVTSYPRSTKKMNPYLIHPNIIAKDRGAPFSFYLP